MPKITLCLLAVTLLLALPVSAQDHDNSAYLENYTSDFNGASKKLADLAGATPADLFGWRPADGIRSVSEVYMHVAAANFALASSLGVAMPADGPQNLEKDVMDKAQVVEVLKTSQDHVRQALEAIMHEDLMGKVTAFGSSMSRYQVLMILSGHSHEHLGQSIAYARSNNVAPPWSGGGGGGE